MIEIWKSLFASLDSQTAASVPSYSSVTTLIWSVKLGEPSTSRTYCWKAIFACHGASVTFGIQV